jgi:hypothetical protein
VTGPLGDVEDHPRVLLPLVLRVCEQERKELLVDELGDRPVVGVGDKVRVAMLGTIWSALLRGEA